MSHSPEHSIEVPHKVVHFLSLIPQLIAHVCTHETPSSVQEMLTDFYHV